MEKAVVLIPLALALLVPVALMGTVASATTAEIPDEEPIVELPIVRDTIVTIDPGPDELPPRNGEPDELPPGTIDLDIIEPPIGTIPPFEPPPTTKNCR